MPEVFSACPFDANLTVPAGELERKLANGVAMRRVDFTRVSDSG